MSEALKFRVSSNIKSIVGKDLIVDKYVAIFELVKNSCDAYSKNITVKFEKTFDKVDKIVITDDGHGMSMKDLQEKWLFLGYSHKAGSTKYAGSKGIGRFACDRLGENLMLFTKQKSAAEGSKLNIDWKAFEKDPQELFNEIEIEVDRITNLSNGKSFGTILELTNLREEWSRDDLLTLRRALMKLVSPKITSDSNSPIIELIAEHELAEDNKEIRISKSGNVYGGHGKLKVNGVIENDVFEKIGLKTTSIETIVSEEGKIIETKLEDRGSFVFSLKKENNYTKLANIKVKLFFLNKTAKMNFTRTMGIDNVNYGSVFIYKNGFRVYPFGSPNTDFFGINERKAQGYNRYLGTRELAGRIEIQGVDGFDDGFIEKSSRDSGFISTPTTRQLENLFLETLRILEKYICDGINWGKTKDGLSDELIPNDVAADKIISQFANLVRREDVLDIKISNDLIKFVKPSESEIQKSIKDLETLAIATNTNGIGEIIQSLKKQSLKLERDKAQVEKDISVAAEQLSQAQEEISIRVRQATDLQKKIDKDPAQLEDALHIIYTLSMDLLSGLDKIYRELQKNDFALIDKFINVMNTLKRIFKLSDLSINYDYSINKKKPVRVCDVIKQYVGDFWIEEIDIDVSGDTSIVCAFDISKFSLIIDNVVTNSIKAKAKKINIAVEKTNDIIKIRIVDDGIGLSDKISNPESIFERGFRTTDGFGLGLYHVKELVKSIDGKITIDKSVKRGFALEVQFKYEC